METQSTKRHITEPHISEPHFTEPQRMEAQITEPNITEPELQNVKSFTRSKSVKPNLPQEKQINRDKFST